MNDIAARIEELDKMLQDRADALRKRTRTTIVIYIVLALVVLLYTSWALKTMKDLTSHQAVAEHLQRTLNENISPKREELTARLRNNSEDLAKECVDSMIKTAIPKIENGAKYILNTLGDSVARSMEDELMPAFVDFIKKDQSKLKSHYADLSDEEVAAGIVGIFVSIIEEELDTMIDVKFEKKYAELHQNLVRIKQAKKEDLTRKDDAERRVLMYWAYLAKNSDENTSIYYDILMQAKGRFGIYFGKDADEEEAPDDHEEGAVIEL